mmetsp:Transcript_14753/g.36808  ORF Transcript_14753/g.36808 Transcript_14753/m.36808 type:complete len:215 (+) Transcript_14753:240-884(+)
MSSAMSTCASPTMPSSDSSTQFLEGLRYDASSAPAPLSPFLARRRAAAAPRAASSPLPSSPSSSSSSSSSSSCSSSPTSPSSTSTCAYSASGLRRSGPAISSPTTCSSICSAAAAASLSPPTPAVPNTWGRWPFLNMLNRERVGLGLRAPATTRTVRSREAGAAPPSLSPPAAGTLRHCGPSPSTSPWRSRSRRLGEPPAQLNVYALRSTHAPK